MPAPKDPIRREEWRRKNSEAHKNLSNTMGEEYHSKEARRKQGEASDKWFSDPENCKKHSEALKIAWSDPERRRKQSEIQKKRFQNPEESKRISESSKKRWANLELRRKQSESHKGEKCHLWKGGISFEPYCPKFNKEFKERVRAFFNYQCVECGELQNGYKLHIHHCNFNKMSCCDYTIPLFVPLCRECHLETHWNCSSWEQHFTDIINSYYGGKCYLTKEEMVAISGNQ